MKKTTKKFLCIFLSVLLLIPSFAIGSFAKNSDCCEYYPTIIIPGFLQSATHLYNEDGSLAARSDGSVYEGPFFLDSTSDIVKSAVKKALVPLLSVLFKQSDTNNRFADTVSELLGDILMEKIKCDENGQPVYNVDAEHYNYSFAECSAAEKAHIINSIPVQGVIDVIGEDHVYFYSYNSLGNLDDITKELYDFIQLVKTETGHDKVNIVPISQGGSIFNNLLEYYPQVMNDFNRIVYAVPALDGTELISDIYKNGLNTADDALYSYMLPSLVGEDTGSLINLLIRILPKSVLKNTLDTAVDSLIKNYLKNCTTLWAFVKTADYEMLADRYLSGEENAAIRKQTDSYQQARINSDKNILKAIENGIEVFNITNYSTPLYSLTASWDKVNADGVIDFDSTSMGAYSLGNDVTLPDGYVQQGNEFRTCSDPENHNHIDPHHIVDASTGLLPDHTFYYYKGSHVDTSSNDALLALVAKLLADDNFKDIYTYPDEFPQFNTARVTKQLRIDIANAKELLPSLNAADAAALSEVIAEAKAMLANTNVSKEETEKASNSFYEVYNSLSGIETPKESFFKKMFNKIIKTAEKKAFEKYGYNSFSGK